jgi:hypothetical protein
MARRQVETWSLLHGDKISMAGIGSLSVLRRFWSERIISDVGFGKACVLVDDVDWHLSTVGH